MTGKIFSLIVGLFLVSCISLLAAEGWWRLWMYHGWIGPPAFLHNVWPGVVDGEASYDATFAEMSVILFLLVGAALIVFRKIRRRAQ